MVARLVNLQRAVCIDKSILLTADRGFGRTTFIQFLLKKKALFVVRVKGDVRIRTSTGNTVLLRKLGKTLKVGMPVWHEQISYRTDGIVTGVNLAAVVAPTEENKEPDPWFLVTNLDTKEDTIECYQERFHIEEWFKDLKHQLGITDLQTKNLMRVRRMLFLSCLAYGLLMVVGTVVDSYTEVKDTLITGGRKAASYIWFALKIIRHNLQGHTFFAKVSAMALGS